MFEFNNKLTKSTMTPLHFRRGDKVVRRRRFDGDPASVNEFFQVLKLHELS